MYVKRKDNEISQGQNKEHSISTDLPIGFGLSLAADERAMAAFAGMSADQKQSVIDMSRAQHTRQDMEAFVHRIGTGTFF